MLNKTEIATRENFKEKVLSEGYEVVLFIYTTEVANNKYFFVF